MQLYVIVLGAAVSAPFLVGEGLLPGLIYACFSRFGKPPGVPGRLGSWCQVGCRVPTGHLSGFLLDTCPDNSPFVGLTPVRVSGFSVGLSSCDLLVSCPFDWTGVRSNVRPGCPIRCQVLIINLQFDFLIPACAKQTGPRRLRRCC